MISGMTVLYEPEEFAYDETYTFVDTKERELFSLVRKRGRWTVEYMWSQRYIKHLLRSVFPGVQWTINHRGIVDSVELTTLHLAMLLLVRQNRYDDCD